jgi:hypothetical protein
LQQLGPQNGGITLKDPYQKDVNIEMIEDEEFKKMDIFFNKCI